MFSKAKSEPTPAKETVVATTPLTAERDRTPQFDPLEIASAHTGLVLHATSQWLKKFERNPLAPELPPIPSITAEDAVRVLESIQRLKTAVEQQPSNARAWVDLTNSLESIGRSHEALTLREKVTGLEPDHVQHRLDLVAHLQRLGKKEEALEAALSVSRLDKENPLTHIAVAGCYNVLGERDLELASLRYATVCAPESGDAWRCLAQCLVGCAQHKEALDAWSKCVSLVPEDSNAFMQRGMLKIKLGDRDGGIVDYREAVRLEPSDTVKHAVLAGYILEQRQSPLQSFGSWILHRFRSNQG